MQSRKFQQNARSNDELQGVLHDNDKSTMTIHRTNKRYEARCKMNTNYITVKSERPLYCYNILLETLVIHDVLKLMVLAMLNVVQSIGIREHMCNIL